MKLDSFAMDWHSSIFSIDPRILLFISTIINKWQQKYLSWIIWRFVKQNLVEKTGKKTKNWEKFKIKIIVFPFSSSYSLNCLCIVFLCSSRISLSQRCISLKSSEQVIEILSLHFHLNKKTKSIKLLQCALTNSIQVENFSFNF